MQSYCRSGSPCSDTGRLRMCTSWLWQPCNNTVRLNAHPHVTKGPQFDAGLGHRAVQWTVAGSFHSKSLTKFMEQSPSRETYRRSDGQQRFRLLAETEDIILFSGVRYLYVSWTRRTCWHPLNWNLFKNISPSTPWVNVNPDYSLGDCFRGKVIDLF